MKQQSAARKKLNPALKAGRERNYAKAALLLEKLISGSDAPAEAWLLLGRARHALKEYSRALAAFNDFINLRPRSFQGWFFAGRSYLCLDMAHKAVSCFRNARSLNAENVYVTAFLGIAYLKSRHSQLAVDTLQSAVENAAAQNLPEKTQNRIYRAYINALFIRGVRLCRLEEYDLGSQMLRFVLENPALRFGLEGGGAESGNDISGAKTSDGPLLRLELGRACRELGENEEALEHYTKALEFNPADTKIRWYRSSILMALGDHDEALKELAAIRAVEPSLPELSWNNRTVDLYMIRSFLGAGEWRRAADCCGQWLKLYGKDPLIHAMYAEALRNLRDFTAALNHLDRAVELEHGNIELWYERILVAWEAENWQALDKALRMTANLGGDEELINRFAILLEAKTGGDDQKVISLLQEAIRGIGPDIELMYALGERYLKIGLADLALNWFNKTIAVMDRHERSWLGRIAALEALASEYPANHAAKAQPEDYDKAAAGLLSKAALRKERVKAAKKTAPRQSPQRLLPQELRDAYDGYTERWNDNLAIRRERALFLIRTFAYEDAAKELEALLAWTPSSAGLRRLLVYAYRKTGRYREAAVLLKSLLKEKPGDLQRSSRYTSLLLEYSGCLERAGAAQYAIAVLEKALEFFKRPEKQGGRQAAKNAGLAIPLLMGLALLYAKEHKHEKAFDLLREAAALDTKDPRPYRLMAALASKNGSQEAVKKFEFEAKKREKNNMKNT